LISSETTFPIVAASLTSDVAPNTPHCRRSGCSYFYIFFRAGPSSTQPLQRYKTLVLSISFSSCSFRCTLCIIFCVEPSLLSCILGPSLLCFSFYLSLFSCSSCRGDYESGGG
jgi:hypothetical protein